MVTSTTFPSTAGASTSSGMGADADRPSGEGSAPAMLQGVAEGAHKTIDRLAEQATPHVQRLQEAMGGATDMLDERADQLRETADEWMETLRCTVRDNPLAAIGAALALGVVFARLTR